MKAERAAEELDSYLYQTVGQDAIEFVARALDVPLYRNVIKGTAVDQGTEYGGRSIENSGGITGDETEDLYELLSTVKVMINLHIKLP
jgi:diphthine-ammonia ligase